MQAIRQLVSSEFTSVNNLIIEQLHSDVSLVENIGHYLIEAGGKRLRPILTLLAAQALGNCNNKHIKLAAVIEFMHTATLLHDDVVDISMLRRGRPTANAEFGNASSVLVGDFIYSRAFQLLVKLDDMRILKLMADTTNAIAEGEVLQLSKAGQVNEDIELYYDIIRRKTAILFAAATSGAAMLNNASEAQQQALHDYGINLGMAFQIADDILDYTGDTDAMGKNVGDDLNEGKTTLPLIYAMANQSPEADIIRNAIETKSSEKIQTITQYVTDCGALEQTQNTAEQFSEAAINNLSALPCTPFRDALTELARSAHNRTK